MQQDKLCYYSKSKNVIAGKGVHEFVNDPLMYNELNKIHNWRQILSNFYIEPFLYEGKSYNSIEHAFQAQKIKLVDINKAEYFTINSGHLIGIGNGSIAQKNRKLVLLNNEQLKHWDNIKFQIMKNITIARISQSSIYKNVLKLTQNAELWHIIERKDIVRNKYMEDLRNNL